ncbi:hypothetical protein [Histidinibacterium aquaticum]|uniref:HEAT repeat domain-containing protein n=1 Tax=Histidinibacterium aquaticum TaxID=2613962 RepID=A0A5J5GMS7_9RHOB|nr:hypothetical protein [Histidinibacterium aquaticum]KAA9009440.1 hypothetical protein F3S47_09365 [Histidinibacterium aquaticum]
MERSGVSTTGLVILGLIGIDAFLIALILSWHLPVLLGLVLSEYAAVVALLLHRQVEPEERNVRLVCGILWLSLGPLGVLASFLLLLLSFRTPLADDEREAWYRELSGRDVGHRKRPVQSGVDATSRAAPGSARTLAEVLAGGNRPERLDALLTIARRGGNESIELVRVALDDTDPMIRSQAASLAVRLRAKNNGDSGRLQSGTIPSTDSN